MSELYSEELYLKVFEMLIGKGIEAGDHEFVVVQDVCLNIYGKPNYILRNIIAHLPNHSARVIAAACKDAKHLSRPDDPLLTDDHITFSEELTEIADDLLLFGKVTTEHDFRIEYTKIMDYAMQHIDDGRLIIRIYKERQIYVLEDILALLPALKDSAHSALTEGAL